MGTAGFDTQGLGMGVKRHHALFDEQVDFACQMGFDNAALEFTVPITESKLGADAPAAQRCF
jgi:hypothetical protein